jgi:hypothetical protein
MTVISNVVEPGATPPEPLPAPAELIERARATAPGLVARRRRSGTMMAPRRYTQPCPGGAEQ